jgi:nucleoside permease NupC
MNYTFWSGILIEYVKMFYFIFSQREKMAGLTIYVPIVRKTLETLIFRVKGMLVANNSPDAFWMGNLKNKTISGDEIMSQVCILCKMSPFIHLLHYCHVIPPCKNYVQDEPKFQKILDRENRSESNSLSD